MTKRRPAPRRIACSESTSATSCSSRTSLDAAKRVRSSAQPSSSCLWMFTSRSGPHPDRVRGPVEAARTRAVVSALPQSNEITCTPSGASISARGSSGSDTQAASASGAESARHPRTREWFRSIGCRCAGGARARIAGARPRPSPRLALRARRHGLVAGVGLRLLLGAHLVERGPSSMTGASSTGRSCVRKPPNWCRHSIA